MKNPSFYSGLLLSLLFACSFANASSFGEYRFKHRPPRDHGNGKVYICTLTPFTNSFVEVGISEDLARYKVSKSCGDRSIFCEPAKASCRETSIY